MPSLVLSLFLCGLYYEAVAVQPPDSYVGYEELHFLPDDGIVEQCGDGSWHGAKLGDEVCVKELGCFKLTADYYHPQYRPCNVLPEPRSLVYTRFILFTRDNIQEGKFLTADNETVRQSGFNANHTTYFIVHGFQENPLHDPWVLVLTRELLNYNNSNVVIVDWHKGSDHPYIQAVANARLVGTEIARMVNALKKFGNMTTDTMHVIGHGLGAHVAGYAGQSILPMVGRITGLDPAYKYFCNMPDNVRLDGSDALFVDVIHTDVKSYDAGHGTCHKLGHLDFFLNDPTSDHTYHEGVRDELRAVSMFISTIRNSTCQMIGYYCNSYKSFLRGECADCGQDGSRCASLGFRADQYLPFKNSNFSSMYLVTGTFPNFCVFEYHIQIRLEDRDSGLEKHSRSGNLLVLLRGEHKPLFVQLRFYSTHDGKEYTFLVTSGVNIGDIKNVTVRWDEQEVFAQRLPPDRAVWRYQSSNVFIERIQVTLLNFYPSQEVKGPVTTDFCPSASTNDPGWLTYLPNCS